MNYTIQFASMCGNVYTYMYCVCMCLCVLCEVLCDVLYNTYVLLYQYMIRSGYQLCVCMWKHAMCVFVWICVCDNFLSLCVNWHLYVCVCVWMCVFSKTCMQTIHALPSQQIHVVRAGHILENAKNDQPVYDMTQSNEVWETLPITSYFLQTGSKQEVASYLKVYPISVW